MKRVIWGIIIIILGGVFFRPRQVLAITPLPQRYFNENVILIDQTIDNNVITAGGTVTIDKDTIIKGDLITIGGDIKIDGEVSGNLIAIGGKITISSTAKISGYTIALGGETSISPEATLEGEQLINQFNQIKQKSQISRAIRNVLDLGGFLANIVSLIILVRLSSNKFNRVWKEKTLTWGKLILRGLWILIIPPIIIGLAISSFIGLPAGMVGLMVYLISLYLAQLMAAWALGKALTDNKIIRSHNEYLLAIVGLTLITALKHIPFVGPITIIFAELWGLGFLWLKYR
ncbi:MAG TPA: polymer-forming cytoskeletal protein [Candidatus Woesebacteria bacterium]|nr:polymer-forming cytoskeletal protein [Candidatus Woesebacteria bacterium]HRS22613.1 polymer-forming cytoskeletal protein [Candidatus Woesebacteria bacterium]HRT40242.1 polymer-forming cytoskeletal protein [Candidatus Woesebacteria bacterium]